MNNTEKIIEIIRREMGVFIDSSAEITPDTNLIRDLHVDSLDLVAIVDTIEEEFGIKIRNDDLTNIRTVNDIDRKINELKAQ